MVLELWEALEEVLDPLGVLLPLIHGDGAFRDGLREISGLETII